MCGAANVVSVVVMELVVGLEGQGHYLVIDDFFSFIFLFRNLVRKGIYAIGIGFANVLYLCLMHFCLFVLCRILSNCSLLICTSHHLFFVPI